MLTPEIVQQTEARFSQRQDIRQEREAKIRAGQIADTPERVRERIQHIASRAVETEGVSLAAPGQPSAPTVSVIERILLKNDLMSINYLDIGARVARTVGRVHIRNPDGSLAGYGTGFLVSPRLLMTNNHVLENSGSAGASRVEFNFQEGTDSKLLKSVFVDFDSAAFFLTDKALDFSLVALKGDVGKFGWNGLSAAEGKVIVGEYVTIIQHPGGERKQIALRENQLVDVLTDFLHYRTDTAPGSSGSPVFNDQWEMVALHHSGVPRKDSQGRLLTKDGKLWNQSMGEQKIDWIANEGIRVSRLLKHLSGLTLSGSQGTLLKQLLSSQKGFVAGKSTSELAGSDEFTTEAGGGGWTLPLQLTITPGQVPSAGAPRVEMGAPMLGPAANGGGEQTPMAASDEFFGTTEGTRPAATSVETALEWLTGEQGGAATTVEDQFR
ncbi:Trypsin-like peptidase domain-containing protein [Rhodospirillales bacterium URHD0017]|nr:Trypsin-like peptidase domain-containing protein [Rhodospirillales bacterium URHD0017]